MHELAAIKVTFLANLCLVLSTGQKECFKENYVFSTSATLFTLNVQCDTNNKSGNVKLKIPKHKMRAIKVTIRRTICNVIKMQLTNG